MQDQIRQATAIVTGASRGIGEATARALATAGFRLVIHCHRKMEAARALADSLPGGPHVALQADLADADAVERFFKDCVSALGHVDVLVNNAGVFEYHRVREVSYADWQTAWGATLGANLLGPANLSFLAARSMIASGGGRIINISSRGAFRGEPEAPAYGASKAALNAMGQSLAKALAPDNVLVFTIAPGWVETDMAAEAMASPMGKKVLEDIPLGRLATPAEIAACVRFLATDAPPSMTGCIIDANGGSYLRT